MNVKRILAMMMIAVVAVIVAGCGNSAKTGVVDVQKVMQESPKLQEFQKQLTDSGKELTDKLEKEKAGLSPEEFQKRQQEVYGEFLKQKQDLESQTRTLMEQTFAAVAKEKGLSVILYKEHVAQGGVDVTEDVVKKLQ